MFTRLLREYSGIIPRPKIGMPASSTFMSFLAQASLEKNFCAHARPSICTWQKTRRKDFPEPPVATCSCPAAAGTRASSAHQWSSCCSGCHPETPNAWPKCWPCFKETAQRSELPSATPSARVAVVLSLLWWSAGRRRQGAYPNPWGV